MRAMLAGCAIVSWTLLIMSAAGETQYLTALLPMIVFFSTAGLFLPS